MTPVIPRPHTLRERPQIFSLPSYSSSAVKEKRSIRSRQSKWTTTYVVPLPWPLSRSRRVRHLELILPLPSALTQTRRRSIAFLILLLLSSLFVLILRTPRLGSKIQLKDPSTLVYSPEDLKQVWRWELQSGHYPSQRKIPEELSSLVQHPSTSKIQKRVQIPLDEPSTAGPPSFNRTYVQLQSTRPQVGYPPRPIPGSIADLDVVMDHCDFSMNQYVRDCLEVLRAGGGLDNGKRFRRGKMDQWSYIFTENGHRNPLKSSLGSPSGKSDVHLSHSTDGAINSRGSVMLESPLKLSSPLPYRPYSIHEPCDPHHPRIFHMFWTGDFTDKPYVTLLSFLYTQNLGLDSAQEGVSPTAICRPQFWIWISPGPAAAPPKPTALRDMFDSMKENPWSAPFLHPRFKNIIKFKLWNTTEQLDGIPEIKDEWRTHNLFNSGGYVINIPKDKDGSMFTARHDSPSEVVEESSTSGHASATAVPAPRGKEQMLNLAGTTSASAYDRLSVILSDMARFVLTHRFGGTYLDADTIFLRDWEELWGWKGAFAYRWSRLERYNTAVLRMNKGSALGSFIFRTALRNGLDFHPMTISRYTKDANLEGLLLRLPDALFDSAWLNTEYYQRDRPPFPFFTEFSNLFDTPAGMNPAVHGFDSFFRGAFSYHFHNFWWKPFDPSRNWPDLGERFIHGEREQRRRLHDAAQQAANASSSSFFSRRPIEVKASVFSMENLIEDDKRDLDWSTVLKRTFEGYVRGESPNMYGEWIEF